MLRKGLLGLAALALASPASNACSFIPGDSWFSASVKTEKSALPNGLYVENDTFGVSFKISNSGSEPFYLSDRFESDFDILGSGLPPNVVPHFKIADGSHFFWKRTGFGSTRGVGEWVFNTAGGVEIKYRGIHASRGFLIYEGEFPGKSGDDRPDDVKVPEPLPFKIRGYFAGKVIEIPATFEFSLNRKYDPKTGAKGARACHEFNQRHNRR